MTSTRQLFEDWYGSRTPWVLEREGDGPYALERTEDEWQRWRHVAELEREACAQACEALHDGAEQDRADQKADAAQGMKAQLARFQHASTVRLFNAGIRSCAAAIRNRKEQA